MSDCCSCGPNWTDEYCARHGRYPPSKRREHELERALNNLKPAVSPGRYPKNEAIPNKSDSGEGRPCTRHKGYTFQINEGEIVRWPCDECKAERLALLERVLEAAREAISGPNRSANLSRLAEAIEAADGTGDGK